MLSFNRVFLFLLFAVLIFIIVISTLSNYYPRIYSPVTAVCENLPPKQYVHPVFIGQGPPIRSIPSPKFVVNRTSVSAKMRCDRIRHKIVLIVHSSVNNSEWRQFQRAQISKEWLQNNEAIVYFVVGEDSGVDISEEVTKYDDILQVNIVENYHNISYKANYWINAISKCQIGPRMIVKIDDDVQVDLPGLRFLIHRYSKLDDFIACRVFPHGTVVRNPSSKWYLSKSEYKYNDLGTYCQGMAYIISGSLIPKMAQNFGRSQILWMDDWYVTRSLVGNQRISYYSLDQHIVSSNSEGELMAKMEKMKTKKYRTIFAHFRPSSRYPIDRQKLIWEQITLMNNSCR